MSRDATIGLICLLGSLGLLAMTRGLHQSSLVPIGPAFYPRILFVVTAVLSALLLITGLRRREAAKPAAPIGYRYVLSTFAVVIAYIVLLPILGYRLGTFLFVGGLQVVLEPPATRRWTLILIVALATAVVTYYVFEVYLAVLLPRGRLTGF
jgi:putative tricarboxylic transport membrane protein